MIHFDFILDAADTENLMSLFGMAISNDHSMIIDEMGKEEPDWKVIDALRNDISYLEGLKLKLLNGAVF